jgi:HK97 gp10 family phage protein
MRASIILEIDRLVKIERTIDSALSDGLLKAAEHVKELASQLAPKDTGVLSNSGAVAITAPRVVEVSFGNNLPDSRAIVQEFGSVFMPAQPYLIPAVRAIDIDVEVAQLIKKRL